MVTESVDGSGVIEADDETERTSDADAARLLGAALETARYPVLAAALSAPNASDLWRELMELLGPQLGVRAPRRSVRAMCRLEGQGYDEPVLIKDISATGVRFLVQTDVALDLNSFGSKRLHVRTGSGPRILEVALVRRCGGDERHTDLACRFLCPPSDHEQLVAEIRSRIFGDMAAPAQASR
jgi:hypothetical protein